MKQHLINEVEHTFANLFTFLCAIGISQKTRACAGADNERGISSFHVLTRTNKTAVKNRAANNQNYICQVYKNEAVNYLKSNVLKKYILFYYCFAVVFRLLLTFRC